MILSIQPVVGWKGLDYVNCSGNTFSTRMLFTAIPSQLYCQDLTLDTLMDSMTSDLLDLYENGLQVKFKEQSLRFKFVLLAVKGDWPFLRKAMKLNTGFTSKIKCHMCMSEDWYDCSKEALTRARAQVPLPSPFKEDEPPAPFLRLPTIAYDRGAVKPDVAHTYAIVGWGKDLAASSLILLYRLRVFPGRSLQQCLDFAYNDFREYCHRRSKCTSIDHFSLKTLKVESPLVL
ncbi:unnamed protein product [Symbiodinium sp. KB8]|nr:unnamed protein product [Symbiodinium sp. KB8]